MDTDDPAASKKVWQATRENWQKSRPDDSNGSEEGGNMNDVKPAGHTSESSPPLVSRLSMQHPPPIVCGIDPRLVLVTRADYNR